MEAEKFERKLEGESESRIVIPLAQQAIRVSIIPRPTEDNPRESIKDEIILQASAMVYIDDESQYLLEVGQSCGMDYKDQGGKFEGTKKAEELKSKIKEFADKFELKILPGIIEI